MNLLSIIWEASTREVYRQGGWDVGFRLCVQCARVEMVSGVGVSILKFYKVSISIYLWL